MSFAPLPAPLLAALAAAAPVRVADLGCGDGCFTRILAATGAWVVGLDSARSAVGAEPRVVGDARHPPLRPGAWDVVVAANLLRHLDRVEEPSTIWARWLDLRRPGGALFVLEDEPLHDGGPATNYVRLQALLAGLPGRGSLLPLAEFRRQCARGPAHIAAAGVLENRYPLDAERVLALLSAGNPTPGGEAAALVVDIARDGIALGAYWWARIERRQGC